MYNNNNPAQARIDSLMQQRQMIDQQIQQVQQYANIPPININNQITPQQQGNFDFNGKWVNNEQEAKNFANANLPTILFDNNKSIFYMKALDGTFKKFKFEEITEDNSNSIENRVNGIEKKLDDLICALSKPPKQGVYEVSYTADITSAAAGVASLVLEQNGEAIGGTQSIYTVATASAYGNVSGDTLIQVPCGASYTIALANDSGLDLSVQNANIIIKKIA